MKLLVIADDLTGATDTGVQFAKVGTPTLVSTDPELDLAELDPDIAVLVIDTETRHVSAEEASARVRAVATRARRAGTPCCYKKTDSTLRGNIGVELAAALEALHAERLAYVPAYPKAGRTVVDGRLLVDGGPVHTTEFGRDPLAPVTGDSIPEMLRAQTALPVAVLPPHRASAAHRRRGVIVFDADCDEDLARIGRGLKETDALRLCAGPAGFAELLPDLLALPRQRFRVTPQTGPVLIANGSLSDAALRQISRAAQCGCVDIRIPARVLLATAVTDEAAESVLAAATEALSAGRDVLLRSVSSRDELDVYVSPSPAAGCDRGEVCQRAARNLGRLVARLAERAQAGALAAFGGDTAREILAALNCRQLAPRLELAPGVAVCELTGGAPVRYFVTKSGGHGPDEVIRRIVDCVRGGAEITDTNSGM